MCAFLLLAMVYSVTAAWWSNSVQPCTSLLIIGLGLPFVMAATLAKVGSSTHRTFTGPALMVALVLSVFASHLGINLSSSDAAVCYSWRWFCFRFPVHPTKNAPCLITPPHPHTQHHHPCSLAPQVEFTAEMEVVGKGVLLILGATTFLCSFFLLIFMPSSIIEFGLHGAASSVREVCVRQHPACVRV